MIPQMCLLWWGWRLRLELGLAVELDLMSEWRIYRDVCWNDEESLQKTWVEITIIILDNP